jgi:hypothetical protein
MSKSLRLSEKWFRRGLWLVAFVFAGFLIGLGGTIVGDLPKVEERRTLEDFIDKPRAEVLRQSIKSAERTQQDAQAALDQAQLKLRSAQADADAGRESFNNWISTRKATQSGDQDAELVARTREQDRLRAAVRQAQTALEAQDKITLDARQLAQREREALSSLEQSASQLLSGELRKQELRVFLYRLLLTLPLLGIAAWLFVKKRKTDSWPFVWGFVIFAGFAFFVELVPYLPSYGGYVRYIVGIIVTFVIGRAAIKALQNYLERIKATEQLPDAQRREELSYDLALTRLAKNVCPGCERPVDLKNEKIDFCEHCGIGLHHHCPSCGTRKSAFSKFCFSCGATSNSDSVVTQAV